MIVNRTQMYLALSLMDLCESVPLKAINPTSLTQYAKVSRQTFYNHFKSMGDAVLFASFLPLYMIGRSDRQAFAETMGEICFFMQRHRVFYTQFAETEGFSDRWLEYFYKNGAEVEGVSVGFRRQTFQIAHSCYAAVFTAWWREGLETPVEKIVELLEGLESLFKTMGYE